MTSKYERGQAIILIAFAIVGLIAIVALAIDGGNVFLDRRRAQNAADTAAYAAALKKIEAEKQFPALDPDVIKADLITAAKIRATSNGYPDSTITVNYPPETGCGGSTNPYIIAVGDSDTVQELKKQYIQVIINSTVNTYFAPIVGIRTLSNCVEAIARAKPGDPISLCYGALVCALAPHDPSALNTFGNGSLTILQGGAFSNSDDDPKSVDMSSNSTLLIDDPSFNIVAVGRIYAPGYPSPGQLKPFGSPPLPTNSPSTYYLPDYMLPFKSSTLPAGICTYYVPIHRSVDQEFGVVLKPGIYCVDGSFDQADYTVEHTHDPITGEDVIDPITKNPVTGGIGGVTIVMLKDGLSWAGTLNIHLWAPTSGPTEGLLIYLPYGNQNKTVKFAGSGNLNIVGTILAPDIGSKIHYSGNYTSGTFKSQLVGWKFEFGGGAGAEVNQPPIIYVYPGDARVELVK